MREALLPPYLEFWHASWPFRFLYLLSLAVGVAGGLLIASASWGRTVLLSAAVLAPLSALLLHITVLTILGRNAPPADGFWLRAGAQVGAALTLFYQFSGFVLPGLALAYLAFTTQQAASVAAACACVLGAAYTLWITPYCVNIVFH